ncbi:MAG: ATP-binding cassette domain-containing protein, partial [Akkermansia sp.]
HKKANNLSGGQAQRAALARTLMKDSDILLLDEPTSGLDDMNTHIIKSLILSEASQKICIVSTHDARLFDMTHEIIDFDKPVSL